MARLSEHVSPFTPRWRHFKDRAATVAVTAGGSGVLIAILLIFFYLLYEVLPLFSNASMELRASVDSPFGEAPLHLAVEEQTELGFGVFADGTARFFVLDTGELVLSEGLAPELGAVTAVAAEGAEGRLFATAHSSGSISMYSHEYRLTYPGGEQVVTPRIERHYPDLALDFGPVPVVKLAVGDNSEGLVVAVLNQAGELRAQRVNREENFITGAVSLEQEELKIPALGGETAAFHIDENLDWLFRVDKAGGFTVLNLRQRDSNGYLQVVSQGELFTGGGRLSTSTMLLGGISLLAASDRGELAQFFMVRDGEGGNYLQRIREFDTGGVVVSELVTEQRRKGFLALGRDGELQIYHTTSHRRLLSQDALPLGAGAAAISPRADALVYVDSNGDLRSWRIHNEHPDISWSALWNKVWYESYDEPAYVWQSSSADTDFEPKYSFAPLAFGTLKAAFYTMMIAAPLAICGAIYTAYFMAAPLRRKIKPMIELMEALPTVILGFLAGLWLAPLIEDKLTAVVTLMLALPVGVLLFAFLWSRLPLSIRSWVPEGWHAAVLIPVVILIGYLSFAANDSFELLLFDGDMRRWITTELGISFDQRNALVVGIAMGMAVIPTIFSIAEDAIFSVPKHLSYGSLALGATPWQTLVGVVIPTASPGIFSGLMIGLGRAVGETMIVLMATGNTPIMDVNIFEGMRTLSANIAVEVPEAEVDSTHYRVLFLAAFVLFMFTFAVNTIAELVRQRLRVKYGSL
ncbi:ABC transporter permease subunit [Haliea sp. E1-2-M8]|uniref:ABC transporter permease subunit n=1 Tax=Haliea sp. E1-2-M8 TaxID=3064706 RepID=UPI002721AC8C|nr:ABC transporter permease subunit [Haliea sp. E1-2-M8]MDO8863926.1 ABC transporter permease subunit [Haliea sp. E1-2-M8]